LSLFFFFFAFVFIISFFEDFFAIFVDEKCLLFSFLVMRPTLSFSHRNTETLRKREGGGGWGREMRAFHARDGGINDRSMMMMMMMMTLNIII
jgi:hypothetical protein